VFPAVGIPVAVQDILQGVADIRAQGDNLVVDSLAPDLGILEAGMEHIPVAVADNPDFAGALEGALNKGLLVDA